MSLVCFNFKLYGRRWLLTNSLLAFLRNFASWVVETFFGDKLFANVARASRKKSVAEYYKLIAAKNEYRKRFHEEVCTQNCRSAIANSSLKHGDCRFGTSMNWTPSSRPFKHSPSCRTGKRLSRHSSGIDVLTLSFHLVAATSFLRWQRPPSCTTS